MVTNVARSINVLLEMFWKSKGTSFIESQFRNFFWWKSTEKSMYTSKKKKKILPINNVCTCGARVTHICAREHSYLIHTYVTVKHKTCATRSIPKINSLRVHTILQLLLCRRYRNRNDNDNPNRLVHRLLWFKCVYVVRETEKEKFVACA